MRSSFDYRAIGRQALQGHWPIAVITTLVASLLGGTLALSSGSSSRGNSNNSSSSPAAAAENAAVSFGSHFSTLFGLLFALLAGTVAVLAIAYALVQLVLGGVFTLGLARYNLNLSRQGDALFSDLFSYFSWFGTAFLMKLLRGLYIFLWGLLFVIPGIMASYSYAMTPFILAENPEMGADAAIGASRQLMYGHRLEYFCLELSFIGWDILCLFTMGIGWLVLEPYKNAARTAFYEDLIAVPGGPSGAPC